MCANGRRSNVKMFRRRRVGTPTSHHFRVTCIQPRPHRVGSCTKIVRNYKLQTKTLMIRHSHLHDHVHARIYCACARACARACACAHACHAHAHVHAHVHVHVCVHTYAYMSPFGLTNTYMCCSCTHVRAIEVRKRDHTQRVQVSVLVQT